METNMSSRELIQCKVCNITRQKCYGLAVTSLNQLKIKGGEALGFSHNASVSVVLEDDGTIIEDEDYFLCLPTNTKFMLLSDEETWTPVIQVNVETGQPNRKPVDLDIDGEDSADGPESLHAVAERLKQNLANIILMSEADLQSLIDMPCSDLAKALGFSQQKTRVLQESLQTVMDRREEERQSKELLQLYLKTIKQKNSTDPQEESAKLDETDGVHVEATAGFSSRILMVLREKSHPETRLSNEELQMVVRQGVDDMMKLLGWDSERTEVLVQDCTAELSRRLQRVQAMNSLCHQSQSLKAEMIAAHRSEKAAQESDSELEMKAGHCSEKAAQESDSELEIIAAQHRQIVKQQRQIEAQKRKITAQESDSRILVNTFPYSFISSQSSNITPAMVLMGPSGKDSSAAGELEDLPSKLRHQPLHSLPALSHSLKAMVLMGPSGKDISAAGELEAEFESGSSISSALKGSPHSFTD